MGEDTKRALPMGRFADGRRKLGERGSFRAIATTGSGKTGHVSEDGAWIPPDSEPDGIPWEGVA